jgi:ubiquinone/menaquinone biosynthesis C-methylase UbiE
MSKKILDACCGSRMMWFDRNQKDTLFIDHRSESHLVKDISSNGGQRLIEVSPDLIADFRELPFEDNSFHLVVFDPPHLNNLGKNSWMAKKYGKLLPSWETDIKGGFDECMRVLKPNGTLIFKWNENQIKINKILEVIETRPLFGHPSGKHGQTIWMTFMKSI